MVEANSKTEVPRILTTGDLAEIISVATRTVAKWIDSGRLKGYRLPDSQDRRVLRSELLRFIRTEMQIEPEQFLAEAGYCLPATDASHENGQ